MALEIILKLDEAQDFRSLPPEKIHIQKRLEMQVISLAEWRCLKDRIRGNAHA
jgi:hypothetical protein